MKNNAKLSLLALSLALGTSMAYASDDIPVVPASVMKKDVPAPVTSGQSSHEVVGSMNENPLLTMKPGKNIINKIECCSVDNLQSLLSIIAAKMKSMIYQK